MKPTYVDVVKRSKVYPSQKIVKQKESQCSQAANFFSLELSARPVGQIFWISEAPLACNCKKSSELKNVSATCPVSGHWTKNCQFY